jgi:hypothetical protein
MRGDAVTLRAPAGATAAAAAAIATAAITAAACDAVRGVQAVWHWRCRLGGRMVVAGGSRLLLVLALVQQPVSQDLRRWGHGMQEASCD